jgi:hypothetical protein
MGPPSSIREPLLDPLNYVRVTSIPGTERSVNRYPWPVPTSGGVACPPVCRSTHECDRRRSMYTAAPFQKTYPDLTWNKSCQIFITKRRIILNLLHRGQSKLKMSTSMTMRCVVAQGAKKAVLAARPFHGQALKSAPLRARKSLQTSCMAMVCH